jgi:DNA-binding IclR family transcriptional regulator
MSRSAAQTAQPTVTALLRGLEVLRCFDYGRDALGSSEIARMTGLPQPTVWRLLKTLQQGGYLDPDADGKRFRPGLAVLTLGYAALHTLDLAELARAPLQEIANRFGAASGLTTRERLSMLYLQRCEAANAFLTVNLRVGSEVTIAGSGTGWAYLAGLGPSARDALIAQLEREQGNTWRRTEKAYRKALDAFERTGYIVNDVFFQGLTTITVPLKAPDRLYVLNCSALHSALATEKTRKEAGAALLEAATRLAPILERKAGR